ncbi:MAG: VOC family protein [Hyphomonadaceae bacterium]
MRYEYRLRQVAFVSADLQKITAQLEAVFGVRASYHDPQVADYGLINGVFPVGHDFIEVVQPVAADASAGRYRERRGGDCGYMVILQTEEAQMHRARLAKMGVREIEVLDFKNHFCTHFHPADFAGVLASIDTTKGDPHWRAPESDWYPAGPDWRASKTPECASLASVTIQHPDPQAAAARWALLLGAPQASADTCVLPLSGAEIRFVPAQDSYGAGVVGLDVRMRDPEAALARAREEWLPVEDGAVRICGAALRPVPL